MCYGRGGKGIRMNASLSDWLLFLFASALAYVIGRYDGKRAVGHIGKTVFIGDWPNGSIQWDSQMSQAQILAFLDKVRAHVLANPLAKPQRTKQQGSADGANCPKEAADD